MHFLLLVLLETEILRLRIDITKVIYGISNTCRHNVYPMSMITY